MPEQSIKDPRGISKPLPEFAEPPLDEVVMGIQFDPMPGFSAAHIGGYWTRIRGRYPNVEDSPPITAQKEKLDVALPTPNENVIRFSNMLPARCMFTSPDKAQLVQLQRDQFYRNWRRFEGTEIYPRYTFLRGEFVRDWNEFREFALQEGLSTPNVNQCELSYINQILKGSGWETFADCRRVFTVFPPLKDSGVLSQPEFETWNGNYKLPDDRGRLHIEIVPAFRGRDFKTILGLTLRARGAPASAKIEDLLSWFDLAHEWAVLAFDEITTQEIQSLWKKRT